MELSDYESALAKLGDDDFTKDGAPKLTALNAALADLGHEAMTVEQRDETHAAHAAHAASEEQPDGHRVEILSASSNPFPMCGRSFRVGETYALTNDEMDTLRTTDVQFKEA